MRHAIKYTLLGGAYASEALALFARFTTQPTTTRRTLINNLVVSLKAAGVWTKLDALYVMAAADAQAAQRNWVADAFNLTPTLAPTFTADQGYTGDGATSYLDTGFNPTTATAPKFVQDSAHLGVWTRSDPIIGSGGEIGNNNAEIRAEISGAGPYTTSSRLNASSTDTFATVPTLLKHTVISRSLSTGYDGYKNGASLGSATRTSAAPSNNSMLVCRTPVGGYSQAQIAAAHIGANLTAAEVLAFYNALNTYLSGVPGFF